MIINHNMTAVNANRQLGLAGIASNSGMEKLSSGMRINKAADDASGLAVSEKMRSQIKGLNQAEKNIQNGVSFIQATEGFLNETQDILQRVRELSVQSANGIYTAEDRSMIQVEVSQLVDEVNRIASHAQFNGMNMLTGRFSEDGTSGPLSIQVGANMDQSETIAVRTMTAVALGLTNEQDAGGALSLTSTDEANRAIGVVDDALKQVSAQRADLGAYQNRFETAAKGVAIASENMQAAESRIRDTDMASEVVDLTKNKILQQAGTAMLGQANVQTQSVLSLLN
ncbi:MAG: flagellin [Spirochaetaceae bacterium 4572_7]|nr:MAG: flagellin [Spirochaetaceae bacterium 4572_7]